MEHADFVFPMSIDPMHYAHLYAKQTAERALGARVNILLAQNAAKDEGIFTLDERADLAHHYLEPDERVLIIRSRAELIRIYDGATKIVRGYRNAADLEELKDMVKLYGFERYNPKLLLVDNSAHSGISSTNLKKLVAEGEIQEACKFAHPAVVEAIRRKIFNV